jgi:hypothetical protein
MTFLRALWKEIPHYPPTDPNHRAASLDLSRRFGQLGFSRNPRVRE